MSSNLADQAQSYLAAFAQCLRRRTVQEPELTEFAELLEEVDASTAKNRAGPPLDHPTKRHLAPLLDTCAADASLNEGVRALADDVAWYQVYQGKGVSASLSEGMLAGQVVGQRGLVTSERLRTGFFLLAPGLHYPLHTHAASEIYFAISGMIRIQHGLEGKPFDIGHGRHSYTPSNRLHSLTTGDAPVLLLYIWMGEVDSPNLIWEQDDSGAWQKARWARQPDASWARTEVTPVADAELAAAK